MQTELPTILQKHRIEVDPTRIAVVGWSTGGHLAMTTAWTAKALGISPPRSIISFYGPIDFESGGKISSTPYELTLFSSGCDMVFENEADRCMWFTPEQT